MKVFINSLFGLFSGLNIIGICLGIYCYVLRGSATILILLPLCLISYSPEPSFRDVYHIS